MDDSVGEEFCDNCLAGIGSSQHHAECVAASVQIGPEQLALAFGVPLEVLKPMDGPPAAAAVDSPAAQRPRLCTVSWGSHGCDKPAGHDQPGSPWAAAGLEHVCGWGNWVEIGGERRDAACCQLAWSEELGRWRTRAWDLETGTWWGWDTIELPGEYIQGLTPPEPPWVDA